MSKFLSIAILVVCAHFSFAQPSSPLILKDNQGKTFLGQPKFEVNGMIDGKVKTTAILSLEVKDKPEQTKISAIEIWHYRNNEVLDFKRINYNQTQTPHQLDLNKFVPRPKTGDYLGIQAQLSDGTRRQFGVFLE